MSVFYLFLSNETSTFELNTFESRHDKNYRKNYSNRTVSKYLKNIQF